MKKERKQDLSSPEEEALEKRVHDMLDITAEEVSVDTEPVVAEPAKVSKSISVTHADEDVVEDSNVVTQTPDLTEAAKVPVETVSTAPLLPTKAAKKVLVTHAEETDEVVSKPPDAKKVKATETPEPVVKGAPEVVIESTAKAKQPTPQLIKATFAKPTVQSAENDNLPPLIEPTTVGDLMDKDSVSPLAAQIESNETDRAVNDIIAAESDQLLAVQQPAVPLKNSSKKSSKSSPGLFKLLITSSGFRWAIFLLVVALFVGAGTYPKSRYYALNKAGVTSAASVTIIDQSTLRPLKNAKATLAGETVTSDDNGKVAFAKLRLGPSKLVIEKRAFATYTQSVTVGWGSNPLADVSLKPQGTQYEFQIKDALSGKAVISVEASVGELVATADEAGKIKLTLDDIESETAEVTIKAAGYRDQKITIELDKSLPTEVLMTPARQVSFISKRTGKYDLYTIDIDGKNEKLILKGTGNESADIALLQHPSADIVIMISTREGTYTSDGRLLNNLTFVNLKDQTTKTVASSTQVRAIDWIGSRLVYVVLNDDANADDPARYKLMSFDYKSGDNRQLASTNYFNSVVSAAGKIYYAPASAYQNGINIGVFAVSADGSGKQPILDQESWNIIRTAHDELTIAVQQEWYTYKPGDDKAQKRSGQPSDTAPRVYVDNPSGSNSAWVDTRDGKGVIVLYDSNKKSDTVLLSQNGLTGPIRWLNATTLLFRSTTGRETADYVVSTDGGSARKVTDVTNTAGIDRWTY